MFLAQLEVLDERKQLPQIVESKHNGVYGIELIERLPLLRLLYDPRPRASGSFYQPEPSSAAHEQPDTQGLQANLLAQEG
jgi:hypothetical protein